MMAQPAPTTAAGGASTTTRASRPLRSRRGGAPGAAAGGPRRRRVGRRSEVGSRKARTLLAALAVAQGAPVAVDVLAEVLWADDLPAKPSEQVGVLVSRLRGSLGADRIPRHDAGYALVADWLDLQELDEGVAAAERSVADGDALVGPAGRHDGARPGARSAGARGERPVVRRPAAGDRSGRSPPPACWPPRRRSSRATRPAPSALAARGLDHDPYDEAALRSLMRAHVALGRPASALAAYAEVRARLAEDLGVSPAAETEALHSEILLARARAGAGGRQPPAAPERWDPLVQRARAELAAVDFDAARRDAERGGASRGRRQRAGGGRLGRVLRPRLPDARCASPRRPRARRGDDERRTERADPVRTGPALARRPAPAPSATSRPRCRAPSPACAAPARCGSATCACTRAGSTEAHRPVGAGRRRRRRPASPVRHPARDVGPHLRAGCARSGHRGARCAGVSST